MVKSSVQNYDFAGYCTRANVKCSDGLVVGVNAFSECNGQKVPLVWNHNHSDVDGVLGHALLENRGDGVYAYGFFNDTENGQHAKELVAHGDVDRMSIYANKLKRNGNLVQHGIIREVSLVLAGANPEAKIESIIRHGEELDDEAVIFSFPDDTLNLSHGEDDVINDSVIEEPDDELTHANEGGNTMAKNEPEVKEKTGDKTIQDVFDSMSEEQKNVCYYLIAKALEGTGVEDKKDEKEDKEDKGEEDVQHNIFESNKEQDDVLMHDAMNTIIKDGKRYGSLKESFLQHAADYGIDQIDWLFPDAKTLTNQPEFIKRDTGWVAGVMNGVHKSAFSRIKSIFADITADEARARGYIKGNLKKEEVFTLLKRTTDPQTVYKKQKLDRDDVIDITDFDVIAFIKGEMRMMLDEEIARAILVGDGRLSDSDDKISESHIRPIYNDADLYTIKASVATDDIPNNFITAAIKSRKNYKGSGNPTLYTTEDMLADLLLLKDVNGRFIYESETQLASTLRVNKIITVPVMEGVTGANGGELLGLIVNLQDYNVGADKGGAVNMFDDFDIDYNQQKYLIETRCSGALIKPYSAIAIEKATSNSTEG